MTATAMTINHDRLDVLNYREREIINLRFGLLDGYCYTRLETSRVFRTSVSEVETIEQTALDKLRSASQGATA